MRVCLDANVLISYLLRYTPHRPPSRIVDDAFAQRFDLIMSELTPIELRAAVESKSYLSKHINLEDLEDFILSMEFAATIVPKTDEQIPSATRDPGDDYLIAHSILNDVDFLVTGDKDLLVLGKVAGVRIVSPATFLALLDDLP